VIDINIGGLYAARKPVVIRTVLGSCVAVCLHDAHHGVGGMNHFLLPRPVSGDPGLSSRYGIHAMEVLINRIMRLGGKRSRLRAKLFGGANVLSARLPSPTVAEKNAAFAISFLETEGIPLTSYRIGGNSPLEVRFTASTARTLVRALPNLTVRGMEARADRYRAAVAEELEQPGDDAVTWFEEAE